MYYPVDEIAKAAGLSPKTVRNWIGSRVLPCTGLRMGKGSKIGLIYHDVLMVIVAAELSHIGIGPKSFSSLVPQLVYNVNMMRYYIKGAEQGAYFIQAKKEPVPMADMVEQNRFFAVYYDSESGNGFSYKAAKPDEYFGAEDTTKVVIDTFMLVFKADEILRRVSHWE